MTITVEYTQEQWDALSRACDMLIEMGKEVPQTKVKVITSGKRAGIKHFFDANQYSPHLVLNHWTVLVFAELDDIIKVLVINDLSQMLALPGHLQCMAQWPGENRSDWWTFTVQDFKDHVAPPEEPRPVQHIDVSPI